MIPITADVSNAIVRYRLHFGEEIRIGDIPLSYEKPEQFVTEINNAIVKKEPIFGGKWIEPYVTEKKTVRKHKHSEHDTENVSSNVVGTSLVHEKRGRKSKTKG